MNGVIVIDKPADYTSFDVIAVVRKLTGQRRTGHTGTLDPNATGVLPVLLGSATKAQDLIPNHDKDYVADFRLGLSTDTLDIWGKVLSEEKTDVSREEIEAALPAFRGEITQIPPMYSAVKQNGQRLYDLARKGVEVERKGRQVTVYRLELNGFDRASQSGRLLVSCSKGTYVRTLIDDLGRALGTCAVMTALRRTAACGFTLDD
ncbi:MAG: tRNA pseudouridine(55) synthase TruB, partial [Ruminococcus sp.]|nr:tRNA pseudouridine(55) synthase TruB [Ruminococcus sp.]